MVRLRADDNGKMLIQELVNRLFEDAEARIREHDVRMRDPVNEMEWGDLIKRYI